MTQQVLMRRANGQFLGTVIVEPADTGIENQLREPRIVTRKEAARRLGRGLTQVGLYHRLAALHCDPYKVLTARRQSQRKRKSKPKDSSKPKGNGLYPLLVKGKFYPDWVIDLKKPLVEPQLKVLRRIRDKFVILNEREVIDWIKANEELIANDLGVLNYAFNQRK